MGEGSGAPMAFCVCGCSRWGRSGAGGRGELILPNGLTWRMFECAPRAGMWQEEGGGRGMSKVFQGPALNQAPPRPALESELQDTTDLSWVLVVKGRSLRSHRRSSPRNRAGLSEEAPLSRSCCSRRPHVRSVTPVFRRRAISCVMDTSSRCEGTQCSGGFPPHWHFQILMQFHRII